MRTGFKGCKGQGGVLKACWEALWLDVGGVNCCGFIQDGGLTLHLLQRQGHTYFMNDALLYVRLAQHITVSTTSPPVVFAC